MRNTPSERPGRRPNPEEIEAELRRAIADSVLRPGQRIMHDELTVRFGVSRIPLREALRTLAAEGLVRIEPGRGTFVTSLDLFEVEELYALRAMVEPSLAEPIVLNASRADINRFTAMVSEMDDRATIGPDRWSRINFAFHLDMYQLANRPLTYSVVSRLYYQLEPFSRYYVHATDSIDRVQDEHHLMMEALLDHDHEALRQQIAAHIQGGRDGLVKAWHERLAGQGQPAQAPSDHADAVATAPEA